MCRGEKELDRTLRFTPSHHGRCFKSLAMPSLYQDEGPGWGFASAIPSHCKSSNAIVMLYFSDFLLIFFSLWFSRKIHTLPKDPIQLQDLRGAETARGQGHQRKGAIHLFCSWWLCKRKQSKWQLFITKSKEFKHFPRTICWVGRNTGLHTSGRCGLQIFSQWMDFLRHLAHSSQGTPVP